MTHSPKQLNAHKAISYRLTLLSFTILIFSYSGVLSESDDLKEWATSTKLRHLIALASWRTTIFFSLLRPLGLLIALFTSQLMPTPVECKEERSKYIFRIELDKKDSGHEEEDPETLNFLLCPRNSEELKSHCFSLSNCSYSLDEINKYLSLIPEYLERENFRDSLQKVVEGSNQKQNFRIDTIALERILWRLSQEKQCISYMDVSLFTQRLKLTKKKVLPEFTKQEFF